MHRFSFTLEAICCMTVFVLLVSTNVLKANDEIEDNSRVKRAGVSGLFPFPRAGRSAPEMHSEWEFPMERSLEEYEELQPMEVKRQGLFQFPRVGRSSASHYSKEALQRFIKRGGSAANGGLWYGPRLGRIQKRSVEFSQEHRPDIFTPRLGRESQEEIDDYDFIFSSAAPGEMRRLLSGDLYS